MKGTSDPIQATCTVSHTYLGGKSNHGDPPTPFLALVSKNSQRKIAWLILSGITRKLRNHINMCVIVVSLRKCTMWELWVKFYLGQNEGGSLGDRTSDSSEKLLQRGGGGEDGGERWVYEWFWWRGNTYNQAHIFPSFLLVLWCFC